MSITISNGFQICNSPLNTSKSKFMYSFPKAQRFQSDNNALNIKAFYDLPSQKMLRTTILGYGQKYDFTKDVQKTPAPNTYNQKFNTIQAEEDEKKGWSFGVSRNKMTQSSGILGICNLFSPGPGKYNLKSQLNNKAYSIRAKTANPDTKNTYLKTPGPGHYQQLSNLAKDGHYFVSKYKSSGATLFNPQSSQRFERPQKFQAPGPGAYQPIYTINSYGRNFISKFQSSKCRIFSRSEKRLQHTKNLSTPGPGSYRLPSEFGYYVDRHVAK